MEEDSCIVSRKRCRESSNSSNTRSSRSPSPCAFSPSHSCPSRSRSPSVASTDFHPHKSIKQYHRDPWYEDLPLEWWERDDDCKDAKSYHLSKIDDLFGDREQLVLQTTLWNQEIVLETNMFPYTTPYGIEHYTIWSHRDLAHFEIVDFVDGWLRDNMPDVRRWQYDDNSGERSISIFHVHIFVETIPYSFTPRPGEEYYPPHCDDRPALPISKENDNDNDKTQ